MNSEPNKPDSTDKNSSVIWQASEYIHHQKSSGWFVALFAGTVVIAGILYLLIHDIFSVIVLVLMAVTIGIFAARPPRTLKYQLSHDELIVDSKHYPLDEFRSFSVRIEGAVFSVTFLPIKRFMVPVTVYFSSEQEASITQILADALPHEERPPDVIDRWASKLRF